MLYVLQLATSLHVPVDLDLSVILSIVVLFLMNVNLMIIVMKIQFVDQILQELKNVPLPVFTQNALGKFFDKNSLHCKTEILNLFNFFLLIILMKTINILNLTFSISDAACVGTGHKATCVCPPGHTGDPYNPAIGCQPLQANICESDADCSINSACRRTETGSMDCRPACDGIQCGPNARCKAINHIGTCQCLPDHTGDANNIVNGCRRREQNECDLDQDCLKSSDVCKPMNNGVKKCFHACKFALCGK